MKFLSKDQSEECFLILVQKCVYRTAVACADLSRTVRDIKVFSQKDRMYS